jgi:phosphoribosylaminoimidazole-succinocarboxamide synthase
MEAAMTANNMEPLYRGSVYNLLPVADEPDHVDMEDTGWVSAGDGKRYEHHPRIAVARTRQAWAFDQILKQHNLPTAIKALMGPTTLQARRLTMIPLEVVARKINVPAGSHRKRFPDDPIGELPNGLQIEFFHKKACDTRNGAPKMVSGKVLRTMDKEEFDRCKDVTIFPDPYLVPGDNRWAVHPAHAAFSPDNALMVLLPPVASHIKQQVEHLARQTFSVLEEVINKMDIASLGLPDARHLVMADLKLEFGVDWPMNITIQPLLQLKIGDTVTLDSMRTLINGDGERHVSKEPFRQGGDIEQLANLYEGFADCLEQMIA